jgi:hypothetical protein
MKSELLTKGGAFTADGIMIEPASITLLLTELQLHEYNSAIETIVLEFNIDSTNPVFRHNKDIIVRGSTPVHDGKNPVQGNRERL